MNGKANAILRERRRFRVLEGIRHQGELVVAGVGQAPPATGTPLWILPHASHRRDGRGSP